jgi:hypothetical protein
MPKRLKLNLSYNDLNKMSLTDLKTYAIKLNNVANLRVRKLRKFVPYSPALLSYEKSELGTFRIGKEADINSLRRSVARAKHFLDMETSTVKGTINVTLRTLKRFGIEPPDFSKKEKRPQGRPKGSKNNKNKIKEIKEKRPRGRPKGSKNKNAYSKYTETIKWLYSKRELLKEFFDMYNRYKDLYHGGELPSDTLKVGMDVFLDLKNNLLQKVGDDWVNRETGEIVDREQIFFDIMNQKIERMHDYIYSSYNQYN